MDHERIVTSYQCGHFCSSKDGNQFAALHPPMPSQNVNSDQEMGVEEALLLVCYVPQFGSNPNLLLKKTLNQTMPTTKENIFTIYQVLRKRHACECGNGLMMMVCHTSCGVAECHAELHAMFLQSTIHCKT